MKEEMWVLMFNDEVLFLSRNLTVLHTAISSRCAVDKMAQPIAYYTARRRILAEGKYVHEPRRGFKYVIMDRPVVHKPMQYKIVMPESTVVKQS